MPTARTLFAKLGVNATTPLPKLDPAEPGTVLKQIASDTRCIFKGPALEFAAQFDFAIGSKRPASVGVRACVPSLRSRCSRSPI